MATSGSFDTEHRISGSYNTYGHFSWSQEWQSVENNQTKINFSFVGKTAGPNQWVYTYGAGVTVDGQYFGSWEGKMYNDTTMISNSKTIGHSSDGTKTLSASGSLAMVESNNTKSGSGSWSLNTIARASQPSINTYPNNSPNFNIGDTIVIHTNRKSGSFTHTVVINYGNTSYTIATGVTDNCSFDTSLIASDLYALIPNANSYSNTISVTTYNGSTNIGTKTCAYTANVVNSNPVIPQNAQQAVRYQYLSASDTATRTVMAPTQFIQNVSTVNCIVNKLNGLPYAQNGATMVKMSCVFAGLSGELYYTDIPTHSSGSECFIALGTPTMYGLQTALLTAVDSRGNSTTVAVNPYSTTIPQGQQYICPYADPSIVASCLRQANFENDTTISISGAMSSLKLYNSSTERNEVSSTDGIQYRYKESTSSTWGSWTSVASTTAGDGSITTTDFVLSLNNQKEWDFEFKITDKIKTTTISRRVGQGQPQFFIGSDGRVAVGGVPSYSLGSSDTGLLDVKGKIYAPTIYENEKRLLRRDAIPIGETLKTTDSSFNPNGILEGTWTKIINGEKLREYVGSQVKYGEVKSSSAGTQNIIGSYGYAMIDEGMFTPPTGYHMAYRITCQGYVSGNGSFKMRLNNITTGPIGTWSGSTFRNDGWSDYFVKSQIALEATLNYGGQTGINIGFVKSGSGVEFGMWQPTLHFYFESDSNYYVWKRTA